VRFHLGTEEIMGKLSLLEGNRLEAGEASIAQIFLEQPATAIWGQPFVIRDSAAEATLAGGSILQPNAGKIRRRQARAIEYLKQLQSRDDTDRLAAAIWFNEWTPMDASNSSRHAGIDPAQLAELMKPLSDRGIVDERAGVSLERITDLGKLILKHLARLHAAQPLLPKHDRDPVLAAFAEHCPPAIFDIAIARLLKARKLVGDAKRFARADFKPRLGEAHLKLMERVIAEFAAAGLAPPAPADYANAVGGSMKIVKEIFQIACEEGLLVKVNDDIYLHKSVVEQMVEVVKSKLVEHGKATVAEIRDWLGTTRKYAVPICEYLDRVKLTRRQGDNRMLV
jgi:selenocysteine-specific elongation factor